MSEQTNEEIFQLEATHILHYHDKEGGRTSDAHVVFKNQFLKALDSKDSQIESLRQQLEEAKKENEALKKYIDNWQGDPDLKAQLLSCQMECGKMREALNTYGKHQTDLPHQIIDCKVCEIVTSPHSSNVYEVVKLAKEALRRISESICIHCIAQEVSKEALKSLEEVLK